MAANVKNERINIVENIALSCGIIWGYNIPEMYKHDMCPKPWSCCLGSREGWVALYEWTPERGFERLWLPTEKMQVDASSHDWEDVEYWDKDIFHELQNGTYVLMFHESQASWDLSSTSKYCIFEKGGAL